jgi:hypothetical protein
MLTSIFSDVGMAAVERIPILGRTGPDITLNEAKFVIDVKSRLSVPDGIFPGKSEIPCMFANGLTSFSFKNLRNLSTDKRHSFHLPKKQEFKSVAAWYSHMHEWTLEHESEGITMLVLHKPGMPIGRSCIIISTKDWSKLWKTMQLRSPQV